MTISDVVLLSVCFAGGYVVISQVWSAFVNRQPRPRAGGQTDESYHRHVLGVGPEAGAEALKTAYCNRIEQYDPTKFAHLAPEFQELAFERTKAILAAYEYLTRCTTK